MLVVKQIADAVRAVLDAESFSVPIQPVVSHMPDFDNQDWSDVRVVIVPRAVEKASLTRAMSQYRCRVSVVVGRATRATDAAAMDVMMGLVQEIVVALDKSVLSIASGVVQCVDPTVIDPIYGTNELNQKKVFYSVITLTYLTRIAG